MDTSILKRFAISARQKLINQIKTRAHFYSITEDAAQNLKTVTTTGDSITINGKTYNRQIKVKWENLNNSVKSKGFEQAVEEVAYTWFNRLIALRFMECNGYIERVLSSSTEGRHDPDIIIHAESLDLPGIDSAKVAKLKDESRTEELYRMLIIAKCNQLHSWMPFMFEKIDDSRDYTELLLPDGLLNEGSIVRDLVSEIPEEDWKNVEIIGWMYQFYMFERKDELIKAKKKYKNNEIPTVTQLYTPDWMVRYMVDNTLGRLWLEAYPDSNLRSKMEFYIEPRNLTDEEKKEIKANAFNSIKPEEIKFLDPACGSGHILVYAFDLLFEMYKESGYIEREIPKIILKNNLYGLDIDERAIQLSCFSILMKARSKTHKIFDDNAYLNVHCFVETNNIDVNNSKVDLLIEKFLNSKTYGSLIKIPTLDLDSIEKALNQMESSGDMYQCLNSVILKKVTLIANILNSKYHCVVTNPPYVGNKYMNPEISMFLGKNYSNTKTDLFSAFIERCFDFSLESGYLGFVTPFVWMFIQSYEKLRKEIIGNKTILSLIQLEYNAFEAACVPACTYVFKNKMINVNGDYIRLSAFSGADNQPIKTREAIGNPDVTYRYSLKTSEFSKIPGFPIAYWISKKMINVFNDNTCLEKYSKAIIKGIFTGNNDRFIRYWYEVSKEDFDNRNWNKYSKGGAFRRWYGNFDSVIKWHNNAYELKKFDGSGLGASKYYNLHHIVWSKITSLNISFRYDDCDVFFDDASPSIVFNGDCDYYTLALVNSKIILEIVKILAPTLNYQAGEIKKIPVIFSSEHNQEIREICKKNIEISRHEWNSFEIAWDFEKHPFLNFSSIHTLSEIFENWKNFTEDQFNQLKKNEKELNRVFIDIYGLQDEMTPEVEDKDVTIRKADKEREIKSFISYAIGCMMGRYSLDKEGLIFAGGEFNKDNYKTYQVDDDGIIPVLGDAWFNDDIVARFIDFVKVTFGEKNLTQNLDFIAEALGKTSNESTDQKIRKYFLTEFYRDHLQTYQKRPIYWLFTSGKKRAFNVLIYMHRYTPSMLAKIRVDYLLQLLVKLETEKRTLENISQSGDAKQKKQNDKRLKEIDEHIVEIRKYDELLKHFADKKIEIDLDDGVAYNYTRFGNPEKGGGDLVYYDTYFKKDDLLKACEWKTKSAADSEGDDEQ